VFQARKSAPPRVVPKLTKNVTFFPGFVSRPRTVSWSGVAKWLKRHAYFFRRLVAHALLK